MVWQPSYVQRVNRRAAAAPPGPMGVGEGAGAHVGHVHSVPPDGPFRKRCWAPCLVSP